jgi:hypothetical protein
MGDSTVAADVVEETNGLSAFLAAATVVRRSPHPKFCLLADVLRNTSQIDHDGLLSTRLAGVGGHCTSAFAVRVMCGELGSLVV